MAAGRGERATGSPPDVSFAAMAARAFDAAFQLAARQVETRVVPFVVLGMAGAERVERVDAFGPAAGSRIGTGAVCLIASITKPITTTAVARLAQEGRFPLTTPLSRWVPELDAAGLEPFTAWHVLTHTSGLRDGDLVDLVLRGATRKEVVRRTIAGGQATAPGSAFQYATFPWEVLALAIERSQARVLEDVIRDAVLDPLGMVDTTFDHARSGVRRAPVRLGDWDGTLREVPAGVDLETLTAGYAALRLAGGGLWSTAADLLRFGRAMLRGGELDGVRVLGRPMVEWLTREVTVDGLGRMADRLADEHYAVGWGKVPAGLPGSPRTFQHGGISGTRLWIDPAEDLVFVYLTGLWGEAGEAIDAVLTATYAGLR
jgi:CubicO group peptidase (beta-lactamase class C family)